MVAVITGLVAVIAMIVLVLSNGSALVALTLLAVVRCGGKGDNGSVSICKVNT